MVIHNREKVNKLCNFILKMNEHAVIPKLLIRDLLRERPNLFPAQGRATFESKLMEESLHAPPLEHQQAHQILSLLEQSQDTQPIAWELLGLLHKNGIGVPASDSKAVDYFRMASIRGQPEAQCMLGVCIERGLGAPSDKYEAVKLYEQAANQGNANAIANLGICYHKGIGKPVDHRKAVYYDFLAADHGHPNATFNLSLSYMRGWGVHRDIREAVRLKRYAVFLGSRSW